MSAKYTANTHSPLKIIVIAKYRTSFFRVWKKIDNPKTKLRIPINAANSSIKYLKSIIILYILGKKRIGFAYLSKMRNQAGPVTTLIIVKVAWDDSVRS